MSVQPVKWRQPKPARDLEWRQYLSQLKLFLGGFIFAVPFFGLPMIRIVRHGDPKMLHQVIAHLLGGGVGFPCLMLVYTWFVVKHGMRYATTEKHLSVFTMGGSDRHPWSTVEWYRIIDYPELDGIRALEFKVKRYRKPRRWSFDPLQVDESAIRDMCEQHLPGKQSTNANDKSKGPAES